MELDHSKNLPRQQETDEERQARQARQARNRARKDKNRAIERGAKSMLRSLLRSFPLCFTAPHIPKSPLKLMISLDLMKQIPADREADVLQALHYYQRRPAYQAAVVEGASRVDLDGIPVGLVTAAEASNALACLQEINQKTAIRIQRRQDERDYRLGKSNPSAAASGTSDRATESGRGLRRYHDEAMAGRNGESTRMSEGDRGGAEDCHS